MKSFTQYFKGNRVSKWMILSCLVCVINAAFLCGQTQGRRYTFSNGKLVGVQESGDLTISDVMTPAISRISNLGDQVEFQWCIGSSAVATFEISRIPGGVVQNIVGSSGCFAWRDTSVVQGKTYVYKIRAFDAAGHASSYSSDIVTLLSYDDDPLISGITNIRGLHFMQMRTAVASVRECAGLPAPTWTDATLSGVPIKAVHLAEIRNQLNAALDSLGVSRPNYTDNVSSLTGITVKAAHIQEIRNRLKRNNIGSSSNPMTCSTVCGDQIQPVAAQMTLACTAGCGQLMAQNPACAMNQSSCTAAYQACFNSCSTWVQQYVNSQYQQCMQAVFSFNTCE